MRNAQKVIDAYAKAFTATMRAAQGPPPPPPTRWQLFMGWLCMLGDALLPPVAQACTVVGIAGLAHLGWTLVR